MVMPVITLADAKQHLRVLHDDDDVAIQGYIAQSSAIVSNYLKKPADHAWTAEDNLVLTAAILMQLSKLYDDRNAGEEDNENVALGYLTPQVTAILHRLRDPAVA